MTKEQMKEFLKEGWKAVLPESAAEDSSDFFTDGGDSIKAVQLTGWLLQKGLKLDMVKVFTTPVLSELADTLTETQPMYVPEEMLTKEILRDKFGIDPAMVSAFPNAEKKPSQAAPVQNPQTCTPARNKQVCTPAQNRQVCTPAQNRQVCTPAQNRQACTPAQWGQVCTPAQSGQLCTPVQNGQLCTPFRGWGSMPMMIPVMIPAFIPAMMPMMPMMPMGSGGMFGNLFGNMMKNAFAGSMGQWNQFNTHPIQAPVDSPNVMKINEPTVGTPEKSAEEALDIVLKGLLPTFDRSKTLFEQGFTSLNLVQIVTRCGENGYRVQLQDIIQNPTFDGIVSAMKPGGEN